MVMKEAQHMVQISSNPNNIAVVQDLVNNIVKVQSLSADLYGNILISITEAVNNAILHGNCCDKSKNVQIRYTQRRNEIKFKISDEGRGFDHSNVADPTSPENICNIGGRGVFLMRQLSDYIEFKDNGRTVEMSFKI